MIMVPVTIKRINILENKNQLRNSKKIIWGLLDEKKLYIISLEKYK